ncbi:MAG: hypothetical protein JNM14_02595 [Ferruginibacter sp.]|nr:hypothetical protein [Ferruginibacter sp.]
MYASSYQPVINRLREHSVHLTKNRIVVFKLLSEAKTALSVSVITKQSDVSLDRISVHRALRYFLQKGLVENVPNNKGKARYILANATQRPVGNNAVKSTYFVCSCCQFTEIIANPVSIKLNYLPDYQVNRYNLIIEGLCHQCKNKS